MTILRKSLCLSLLLLLMMSGVVPAADNAYRIEQVDINMPDVTAFYATPAADAGVEAWLDGEKLELNGDTADFASSGEGASYYVLLDVSGSMLWDRFEDVKASLKQFLQEMREQDQLILQTFGDEVKMILDGSEDRTTASSAIDQLSFGDMNTVLFDAISQTSQMITDARASDGESRRRVMVIFSDGADCADNTRTADSEAKKLTARGITAYTVAIENNQQSYSESEKRAAQAAFSSVAEQTGGLPWTASSLDVSTLEAIEQVQKDVLESRIARFKASSNKVSNQNKDFVLKFSGSGSGTVTRQVLVDKGQPDLTAPTVALSSLAPNVPNAFLAVYTEKVVNADKTGSYTVEKAGKILPVAQVIADPSLDNAWRLIMNEDLENTEYQITVSNVTDDSNEKNALTESVQTVKVTGGVEQTEPETQETTPPEVTGIKQSESGILITYSEAVKHADENGSYQIMLDGERAALSQAIKSDEEDNAYLLMPEGGLHNGTYKITISNVTDKADNALAEEDKTQELEISGLEEPAVEEVKEETVLDKILKWWPVVLTLVVLALILLIVLYMRRVKKRRLTIVDGELVEAVNVNKQVHVGLEQDHSPTKRITIWLTNGTDEPKKIEQLISGSIFVGRSPRECDIYCDDPHMSKQHFNLSVEEDGSVYVTDLQSMNGTSVNGVRIQGRRKLAPHDEITAGSIRFILEWDQ